MDRITCHLLPYQVLSGPKNMAVDEIMLQRAAQGVTSLRFYGWSEPTLSLGYFQPVAARESDPVLAKLPYVRRASGGAALVHHHELTYALALAPEVTARQRTGWIARIHQVIADVLRELGVKQPLTVYDGDPKTRHEVLCFGKITPGDLLCGDAKIVGSAQRKHRQSLLQHGGILLAQSKYTPTLPGLAELAGVGLSETEIADQTAHEIQRDFNWELRVSCLDHKDHEIISRLQSAKYHDENWNNRR